MARTELGLSLGHNPTENWAEHVCVPSLAGVYAQVWVCRQSQSLRGLFHGKLKILFRAMGAKRKGRGKEPRVRHLGSDSISPLLGRSLDPSGPQFPSLSKEEPRLDDSLVLYKCRNSSIPCAMCRGHFNTKRVNLLDSSILLTG